MDDDDQSDNSINSGPRPRERRRAGHRGYYVVNRSIDRCMFMYKNKVAGKSLPKDAPDKFTWPVYGDFEGAARLIDTALAFDLAGVRRLLARYPQHVSGLETWLAQQSRLRPPGVLERRVVRQVRRAGSRRLLLEVLVLEDGAKVPALCLYDGARRVAERRQKPKPKVTQGVSHA